jgi:hypothetical protein
MLKELGLVSLACLIAFLMFYVYIPFVITTDDVIQDKKTQTEKLLGNIKSNKKVTVPIFYGICSLDQGAMTINTVDPTRNDYINIPNSFNQDGGAQYSYSFWLRRGMNTNQPLRNTIIFYKGSPLIHPVEQESMKGHVYQHDGANNTDKNYLYKDFQLELNSEDSDEERQAKLNDIKNNRFIKSPLVRFGKQADSLRIELNTLKNPHLYVDVDAEIFSLLKSSSKLRKYNLITFSVRDNVDFGGAERGIRVDVYIDDALVKTQAFENNALMLNNGHIHLFPSYRDTERSNAQINADIAELTYYNFALNNREVEQLYSKGFTDGVCRLNTPQFGGSNNRYNKVNLFNETRQI